MDKVVKTTVEIFVMGKCYPIEVYGYNTKGLPGLEIVGLGVHARSIKEKIIFTARQQQRKIPLGRYVLCVDLPIELRNKESYDDVKHLEWALYLLFLSLAESIGSNVQEKTRAGIIRTDGKVIFGITETPTHIVLIKGSKENQSWL